MYRLTDNQIDFILNDIRSQGISMETLQMDILDHVCCMIEREIADESQFMEAYSKNIVRFYKNELSEIEFETKELLTNKYLYHMKKLMILSGGASAMLMGTGLVLKFLHLPGAAIALVLGTGILSLIFLPLMFLLKFREERSGRTRVVATLGSISAMLISLGILFKVMHWPGANIMSISALLIMLFLFIPIYFFAGIKNADSKVNTIVTSVLMFAVCGLILTLVRAPATTHAENLADTKYFYINDLILRNARNIPVKNDKSDELAHLASQIDLEAENLKKFLLTKEIGTPEITSDFEKNEIAIGRTQLVVYLNDDLRLQKLRGLVEQYNQLAKDKNAQQLPISGHLRNDNAYLLEFLNDLTQLQMFVLQQRGTLIAMK